MSLECEVEYGHKDLKQVSTQVVRLERACKCCGIDTYLLQSR